MLDARENGPAASAGVHGTKRDPSGRLMLGDIITGFNTTRVKCAAPLLPSPLLIQPLAWMQAKTIITADRAVLKKCAVLLFFPVAS